MFEIEHDFVVFFFLVNHLGRVGLLVDSRVAERPVERIDLAKLSTGHTKVTYGSAHTDIRSERPLRVGKTQKEHRCKTIVVR